jgi:hypothetical protein
LVADVVDDASSGYQDDSSLSEMSSTDVDEKLISRLYCEK